MKLETWVSLASFGLAIMFVALILSLYNFLIGPEGEGPNRVTDPGGLLIQQVSISAAPSIILACFVFVLTRTTGNRPAGLLLVGAGAVMIAGMLAALGLLPRIPAQYAVGGITVVPYIFAVAGAAVAGLGGYLTARATRVRAPGHLDDLR